MCASTAGDLIKYHRQKLAAHFLHDEFGNRGEKKLGLHHQSQGQRHHTRASCSQASKVWDPFQEFTCLQTPGCYCRTDGDATWCCQLLTFKVRTWWCCGVNVLLYLSMSIIPYHCNHRQEWMTRHQGSKAPKLRSTYGNLISHWASKAEIGTTAHEGVRWLGSSYCSHIILRGHGYNYS